MIKKTHVDETALLDSASTPVRTDADADPVLTDEPRPPLSVELLDAEADGVVATTLGVEVEVAVTVEDKAPSEVDFEDRADSAAVCPLVWVREDVNPDDADADEDVNADEVVVVLEGVLELGVIVELVNRDFDKADEEEEGERVDVAAMDEGEDLEVNVVAATDVGVDLVEETDEESLDEESLVDNAGADVARGSSADEVVSDPAPASSFARLVKVTAPMNQNRQPVPQHERKAGDTHVCVQEWGSSSKEKTGKNEKNEGVKSKIIVGLDLPTHVS